MDYLLIIFSVFVTQFVILVLKNPSNDENFPDLNILNSHIAALILARGGSKGIRLKNLAFLHNETLLARTLKTLRQFEHFHSIWVSTDNLKIAEEAEKYDAKVHWRQPFTATDDASSVIAVKEFIQIHPEINVVVLVQCTSPFLQVKYLNEAYSKLIQGFHSIFTVTRNHKLRWKIKKDGSAEADNFNIYSRPRRQDWEGELVENGMFYITYADLITNSNILQGGKTSVIEVPANESLEIDTEGDLKLAKCLLHASDLE